MSMMPLGGASFEVVANTDDFARGMQQAQAQAQRTSQTIYAQFNRIEQASNNLAIVPRQLAAINQTAMTTTAAIRDLADQLARAGNRLNNFGGGGGGGRVAFGHGGGVSGLMVFAQTLDDLQYGFRSIVNNMPQLGMAIGQAFGMGAESAGALGAAVGIAAVAINQGMQHWNELKATFGDTAPFETAMGAIEMLKAGLGGEKGLEGAMAGAKAGFFAALGGKGPTDDDLRHAREMDQRALDVERGKEAIGKFRTPEEQQRAKDFGAALGAYGGPAKLMQDMVNEGLKPHQGKIAPEAMEALRKQLTENAILAIQGAMQGKDVGNVFGKKMGMLVQGQAQGRIMKGFEAQGRQDAEARMKQDRLDEAEMKDWRAAVDRAQKEINADKKRQAREDEANAKRQRHVRRNVRDIMDSTFPRERDRDRSAFVSFTELSKRIQTAALDQDKDIQMRQLKALQRIADLLEDNPDMATEIRNLAGLPAVPAGPN